MELKFFTGTAFKFLDKKYKSRACKKFQLHSCKYKYMVPRRAHKAEML